jgi:hypothetical protein
MPHVGKFKRPGTNMDGSIQDFINILGNIKSLINNTTLIA